MAKNNTAVKVIAGILVVAGVYFVYKYFQKPSSKTPKKDDGETSSGGGSTTPTVTDSFPLKKGKKGDNVARLQNALKKNNPSALPRFGVDKDFGSETEAELVKQTGKKTITESELTALEGKKSGTQVFGGVPFAYTLTKPIKRTPVLTL
jgi:hypothetical protein